MSHQLDFIKASCGIVSITPMAALPPIKPYKSNVPAIIPASTAPHMENKRPRNFQVVLLNDDYTPMRYVERVLQRYFHKDAEEAANIMMRVHSSGQAVAGTYSYEVAEQKTLDVEKDAQHSGHPFKTRLEPV